MFGPPGPPPPKRPRLCPCVGWGVGFSSLTVVTVVFGLMHRRLAGCGGSMATALHRFVIRSQRWRPDSVHVHSVDNAWLAVRLMTGFYDTKAADNHSLCGPRARLKQSVALYRRQKFRDMSYTVSVEYRRRFSFTQT